MDDFPFQLILIIVFLVIGAIRWVIENVLAKKRPPQPQQWEEFDHEQEESTQQSSSLEDLYEEARREILDRQNRRIPQPEAAPPPLPGKARINRPAHPAAPPTPEPKRVKRRPVTEQQAQAAAAFELNSQKDKKTSAAGSSNSRVRKLLASPTAARDAIILAEVLSKPKGVR